MSLEGHQRHTMAVGNSSGHLRIKREVGRLGLETDCGVSGVEEMEGPTEMRKRKG
jgi:hypothetical protein